MNTDVALKRITLEGPSNRIVNREVKTDSTYGEYEEVLVEWGEVQAEDYDMKYYLFSTDSNPIRIDSIVFDDPLTFFNKKYEGSVITKSMNLTGDNELPVKFINSPSTVINKYTGEVLQGAFLEYFLKIPDSIMMRDRYSNWDSTIDMTVYGKDTVANNLTKLVIKFHAKQTNVYHIHTFADRGLQTPDSILVDGVVTPINLANLPATKYESQMYGYWGRMEIFNPGTNRVFYQFEDVYGPVNGCNQSVGVINYLTKMYYNLINITTDSTNFEKYMGYKYRNCLGIK